MRVATLVCPRMKSPSLAPKAAEATLNTRASMAARPTKNTAALPTHMTFPNILLTMCPAPILRWDEGGASPALIYIVTVAYSLTNAENIS